VALARPVKAPLPSLGRTCGRRERETVAGSRAEQSVRRSRGRDGERHPGLRDDGALRGAPPERRPWSVRDVGNGAPPLPAGAPMTADVQRAPKDGNDVGLRDPTRRHPSREAYAISRSGRTRPSLGPLTRARRSPLQLRGVTSGGGALESISRSGKPAQAGGTGTGVEASGRSAARRASPLPQGRPRDATKKRKGVTALVPARIVRARAECPFIVLRCRSRQATSGPK